MLSRDEKIIAVFAAVLGFSLGALTGACVIALTYKL